VLDVYWALMLGEGRGGFMDYSKYRDRLTDIVWRGKVPELTPEERAEAAKHAAASPPPQSALEEARAMYEASKQRLAAEKN
jgi:hypothetical protein